MDKYTPLLLNGLRVMIGKGERSKDVTEEISKYDAVYFICVGGISALLAQSWFHVKHFVGRIGQRGYLSSCSKGLSLLCSYYLTVIHHILSGRIMIRVISHPSSFLNMKKTMFKAKCKLLSCSVIS